jgi:Mg-chelatase subunit ChlD
MRAGRTRGLGLLGLAWLLATSALAGEPASLRISQALAEGTQVKVYARVSDALGAPVADETLTFHATLGTQVAEVVSSTPFAASGEGVLYLFLVDLSRSLDAATFERIRQALREWMAALGPQDRAAILSFGTQVRTLVAPTADPAALNTAIASLKPTEPHTALHEALAQGLILGQQRGADLPSRRALVVLSDGRDDAPGGMTGEEVEARLTEGAVPIYAMGFSRARDRASREAGLAALGRFARQSGGLFIDASAGDLAGTYAAMRERIREVLRLEVRCPGCVADGNRYRLQLALTHNGRTLSDGVDVRLYPPVTVAPSPAAPGAGNSAPAGTGAGGGPSGEPSAPGGEGTERPADADTPGAPAADAGPEGGSEAGQGPGADGTPATGPNPAGTDPVAPAQGEPATPTGTGTPAGTAPRASPPGEPAAPTGTETPVGTAPGASPSGEPAAPTGADTPAGPAPGAPPSGAPASTPASAPILGTLFANLAAWWPWLLGAVVLGGVLLFLGLRRRGPGARSTPPVLVPEAEPLAETPITFPPPPPSGPIEPTRRQQTAPAGPALTLAYMKGRRRGEVARLVLAPDGVIGRNGACALPLVGDDEVSARHARLFVQDRRLLLEDLGSTNGTWLNGVRLLAPTPLREGDVLRVGQTELRLGGIGDSR